MAIDLNDEILQDFLVEGGEILEQLDAQLVDLEQSPDDTDLLNSIFRGFHTIKGGGSFLALTNLVSVCHKAEDVFNLLRNHELALDASMMDVFLRVLDELNKMFGEVREGQDPTAASDEILQRLEQMQLKDDQPADETVGVEGSQNSATEPVVEEPVAVPETSDIGDIDPALNQTQAEKDFVTGGDDITDDEFEALLDALHSKGTDAQSVAANAPGVKMGSQASKAGSDEISEEEFESLLDDLHGVGGAPAAAVKTEPPANDSKQSPPSSDEISEDEFDAMLDQMHGKGKAPGGSKAAPEEAKKEPDKESKKAEAKTAPPVKPVPATTEPETKPSAPAAQKTPKAETTVRVDTSRLDEIMNLVGELVLARNRLNTLKETFEDDRVHKAISNLDAVTGDLQAAVMKTRMQPVKKVFGRFPRVVRDLARSMKKEVVLEMVGEDTDLDKNLVEALADPLVHLVRNSVDHGIELPDARVAAGKQREGKVILAAQQEGDHILLSITDDGAGMDPEVLRRNAVKKGLMDEDTASRLDNKSCFDLIFLPGLTTKEQITSVSGRGVGMDVVKTRITQLNGTVEIDSELGKGTVLSIKVPLTLAILPTLMVQLGQRKFALPLSNVSEIFELNSKKISIVDGKEVVLNRGHAPPLFYLRRWLLNGEDADTPDCDDSQVIMVQVANTLVGLVVDQVIGQEEVVIKPLGALLHGVPGMAGSTITGDGNIAIILDVQGLLKCYA